jgi:predicted phage tail protein
MSRQLPKKIAGFKGGGSSSSSTPPQPREVEDTIQSTGKAYLVDLLCEGEIDKLNALYIDEALYSASDFPTVTFDSSTMFRKGLRRTAQTPLPDRYAGAKVPLPIPQSNRLRKTRPITIYFNSNTYPDATSVLVNIRFPTMMRQVEEATKQGGEVAGDIRETSVEYWVTLTENGIARDPIKEVVRQKSAGGFIWSTRVNLNPDPNVNVNKWKLKIERITADSNTVKLSNDTYLDSIIIETSYSYNYPNSVVAALAFDAQNFPQIGQRAYDLNLLKVKVPAGYTPTQYDANGKVTAAATYPGVWNGTFSATKVWTNNPAWIFYDLITNKRYGLGEYVSESSLDKWTLYQIAKYCDELVDNGTGEAGLDGKEPRFACNLFLTTQEEAFTVINNLASVFRGICYWMSGKIFPVQDKPKSAIQLFTNANVLNGLFTYSSTGKGQRRTVCNVRWNDPEDFFRPATETVEDTAGVIRFGVREFDVGAFACTSRGQAYRVGKWSLLSERLETEIVSFDTATEGIYSRPGDIIEIYDDFRYAQKQGGRVLDMNSSATRVVLDRIMESGSDLSYTLSLNIPKANRDPAYTGSDANQQVTSESHIVDIRKSFIETSNVVGITYSGDKTVVDVSPAFSEQYIGGSWSAEASHASSGVIAGAKKYRVLNLKETEEKNISITALEYSDEKFDISETGYTIRTSPSTNYAANPINPPASLSLNSIFNVQGENFSAYIKASWVASNGPFLSHHVASGRLVGSPTWTALQVYNNGTQANYFPSASGEYEVIVAAVQVGGAISDTISSTVSFGTSNPLGTSVIPMDNIVLVNHIPGNNNQYADRQPSFLFKTIPSGADGTDQRRAFLRGMQFRFKDYLGVVVSDYFTVEENESVVIPYNFTGIQGWPFRSGTVEVRAIDYWGNVSATKSLIFSNPAPPTADLTIVSKDNNSFKYILDPNGSIPSDFSGVLFWLSTGQTRPNSFYTKADSVGELTHNLGQDKLYAWWAMADTFSYSGLNIAGPVLIDTGPLTSDNLGITLALSGHRDDWGNEHNTVYATWDRINSGDIRDYYLYLKDNTSGALYTYLVPQPDSGQKPFFHIDSVVPDRTYSAAVRARNGEGRKSPLSAYAGSLYVPKPTIRYLQVEGRSYFFEPTSVRLSQQTVNGSQNIDFGQGNIIRLNLNNAGTAVLSPSNIISGATYLIYLYRQANSGPVNFSSNFKWPDGEAPDISTSVGMVDVVSAFAIDSGNLYAVAVNNMS